MTMQPLCEARALAQCQARGFDPLGAGHDTVFVVHSAGRVRAWLDRCPHLGTPMAWRRNAYFNGSRTHIACHAHGALFEMDTGLCVQGPCLGERLTPLPLSLREDGVWWVGVEALQALPQEAAR